MTHELRPLSAEQVTALMGNLNPARVAKRKQSGMELSYLEGYDIKATLIRLFGFGGFSAEVLDAKIIDAREVPNSKGTGTNQKVTAQARVRLTIHQLGAIYTEDAVAGSTQPDFTEAADTAIKSAETDALKRAAIYLGTQLGLSLYRSGSTREVVNVLFEPEQKALLEQAKESAPQGEGVAKTAEQAREQVQRALSRQQADGDAPSAERADR